MLSFILSLFIHGKNINLNEKELNLIRLKQEEISSAIVEDDCLTIKARDRARYIVDSGLFSHYDENNTRPF